MITVIGLQVALTLSGAVLTETHLQLAGPRHRAGRSTPLKRDYIAVQGLVTFFALIVVLVSLIVDIINALSTPTGEVLNARVASTTIWNTKGLARWILLAGCRHRWSSS